MNEDKAPRDNEQDTDKSQLAQDIEIARKAAKDKDLEIGDAFSGGGGGSAGDGGGS